MQDRSRAYSIPVTRSAMASSSSSSSSAARGSFTSIPILDYKLLKTSRTKYLAQLAHAATNVGFLYLRGAEEHVPVELIDKMKRYTRDVFRLPLDRKLAIKMEKSPAFLGYNLLGHEITKGKKDNREQFDFRCDLEPVYREGVDPPYLRAIRPCQWPEEGREIDGFKEVTHEYIRRLTDFSYQLTDLLAEALGLRKGAFDRYFDELTRRTGRIKMIRYPPRSDLNADDGDQGVGPHKDAWLTFLLQVTPGAGLEAQNVEGEWIPVPPIDGAFVVNFGFFLEAVTHGAVIATTHRVVSPAGTEERLSLPFFQDLSMHAVIKPLPEEDLPPHLLQTTKCRKVVTDAPADQWLSTVYGESWLVNRIKSHPDVGLRHYPDLYHQYARGDSVHPGFQTPVPEIPGDRAVDGKTSA